VLHRPGEDVGDGLDAAVRMPRETGEVILRPVVAEIIQQQERIELLGLAKAEGAPEPNARPPRAPVARSTRSGWVAWS
jgi:hypothetical protein